MTAITTDAHPLRLGLPGIDDEHMTLLGFCDDVLAATEKGAARWAVAGPLERLIAAVRAHFAAEETMLERCDYPGLLGHRAEHARLLTQAEALMPGHAGGLPASALVRDTIRFLRTRLVEHIQTADLPCGPFVRRLA